MQHCLQFNNNYDTITKNLKYFRSVSDILIRFLNTRA